MHAHEINSTTALIFTCIYTTETNFCQQNNLCRTEGINSFGSISRNDFKVNKLPNILVLLSQQNHEHQKHFWNVIVLQEKSQSGIRKTNPQARMLISLWLGGKLACPDLCCDWS